MQIKSIEPENGVRVCMSLIATEKPLEKKIKIPKSLTKKCTEKRVTRVH